VTKEGNSSPVEVVTWSDVRDRMGEIQPQFAQLIDDYQPGDKPLLLASYPFASHLITNGDFHLPDNHGKITSLRKGDYAPQINELLDYNWKSVPFGIALEGYAESYWHSDVIQPTAMLYPGATLALRTIFDQDSRYNFHRAWNLSSGARLMFILSSIKDSEKFKRLQRTYQFREDMPVDYQDQWKVFKKIYNSPQANVDWRTKVVFFTKSWIEDILGGKNERLTLFLLNSVWRFHEFERNRRVFDFIMDDFKRIMSRKGVKINSYSFACLKHLIRIAMGEEFGFSPMVCNEVSPHELLFDAYTHTYRTKKSPTFMRINKVKWDEPDNAVYYSMHFPLHVGDSYKKNGYSNIDDTIELKQSMEIFLDAIEGGRLELVEKTRLSELPDKIKFDYFHTDSDPMQELTSSKLILSHDPRFVPSLERRDPAIAFNHASPFFKGCIKITYTG
tara:strand:+ start:769 stop:2106 length:1338 start_codon:yes stop_codon:yes gene_type:complete